MTAIRVIGGTANPVLAEAVAERLAAGPAAVAIERFPDGELRPMVDGVAGQDVYVVAPTSPPVSEHLLELALVLDASRRAGAVTLAERYAVLLGAPVAMVRSYRVNGHKVHAEELVGEVAGRRAVVVDDMVSTGATTTC
ncbi:MAG: ribose-phosphate pyrophosphokinase-like domain-containing protein [Actinomycetota bacterium]|nr:ribose-phosphate pyrophosphokinase-like domain-containing protein [Actinomycetota bacterium]